MKKTDLIIQLSEDYGLSKEDSKICIELILEMLTSSIASGEGVEFRDFGAFHKRYRKPRIGVNPKTSERTKVGEKFVPFFKSGKKLKELLNKPQKNKNQD